MQQEGDYSLRGRGSGQVKAAEAPGIGEMGLGAEPGPSFTPQARGSSTSMPWGVPLDGMGQRLGRMGTGRLGVLLTVKHIGTQNRNKYKNHNYIKIVMLSGSLKTPIPELVALR